MRVPEVLPEMPDCPFEVPIVSEDASGLPVGALGPLAGA